MRQPIFVAAMIGASLSLVACGQPEEPAAIEIEEPAGSEDEPEQPAADEPPAQAAPTEPDEPLPAEPGVTPPTVPEAGPAEGPDQTPEGSAEEPSEDPTRPDDALLDEPCAEHQGREDESFIELVAPVDEQDVEDEVEIVGCSNVFEATIAWMLLDGDGRTLDEGFTTAECGSGCVGLFRDTVPLDAAAGEPVAYLQVYSQNMAGEGPDQLELTEVILVLR